MQNFYCISSRVENSGKLYGCFKIGPLNQSLTFANALRRTLLAESPDLDPGAKELSSAGGEPPFGTSGGRLGAKSTRAASRAPIANFARPTSSPSGGGGRGRARALRSKPQMSLPSPPFGGGASSFGPPPARVDFAPSQSGEAPLAAGGEPYIAIQIYGIEHEFSTLLGVRESVLDIIANLEAVRYQITKPLTKPKIAFCNFYGPGILQAKHIHFPSGLKCIQPSQYIATVEIDGKLIFKLFFSSTKLNGSLNERVLAPRGAPFAREESRSPFLVIQTPHSIVEKVNYTMLPSGALFFEVWTNGSMHPQNAILNAINKLLLEIFPYSKKISSLREPSPFLLNEKLLNLEVSNFYFNLETYLFFKKKGIHRVIDFLNFWKNNTDIDLSLRVPVTRRPLVPQRGTARQRRAVAPPAFFVRPAEGGERGEQRDFKPRAIFKGFTPPEARGGAAPVDFSNAPSQSGAQSIFKFFNYIANLNIDPLGSILTFNLQQEYELRRNSMLFQFHQEDSEQVQQHVLE